MNLNPLVFNFFITIYLSFIKNYLISQNLNLYIYLLNFHYRNKVKFLLKMAKYSSQNY